MIVIFLDTYVHLDTNIILVGYQVIFRVGISVPLKNRWGNRFGGLGDGGVNDLPGQATKRPIENGEKLTYSPAAGCNWWLVFIFPPFPVRRFVA